MAYLVSRHIDRSTRSNWRPRRRVRPEMMNDSQEACISLLASNMPEHLKNGPIFADIFLELTQQIMGEATEEKLLSKSIRAYIEIVANQNRPQWSDFIENYPIERFSNTFLSKSPDLMMSIFENCEWEQTELTEATIIVTSNTLIVEVNKKTYISLVFDEGTFTIPNWLPHLFRRLVASDVAYIDVQFKTAKPDLSQLQEYKKEMFDKIENANLTGRGNHEYEPLKVKCQYVIIQGTLNFCARHGSGRRNNSVFVKFSRRESADVRDINDVIKEDFSS